MFKQTTLSLACAICLCSAHAQDRTVNFKLILPENKVSNSLYNNIEYQDVRPDPLSLGVVQLGIMNNKAHVRAAEPLSDQLQNVISNYTDSTAENGKLLFVVRRFTFKEVTKSTSEKGYFYIRGTLFAKENESYRIINDLDTIVEFKALDVTQRLLREGSKIIVDFVGEHLRSKPAGPGNFSYYAALHIDSIRKSSIPLYNIAAFKDGVYKDYEEFKMQSPGITQFKTVKKKDNIRKIMVDGDEGQEKEIDNDDIYAVVIEGKPFIATTFGYYPLEKRQDDYYYTGKIKIYKPGSAIMGGLMFGLAGALIAGSGSDVAHQKLDYVNGMFLYAGSAK